MYKRTPVLFLPGDSHRSHRSAAFHAIVSFLVVFQYAPFSVHYRAQIMYRLLEETGRLYLRRRRRCQLPHLMLFHPDFCRELFIGTVMYTGGVYIHVYSDYLEIWRQSSFIESIVLRGRIPTQSSLFISILFIKCAEKASKFFIRRSFCLLRASLFSVFQFIRERQTRHRQQLAQISRLMVTSHTKEYRRRFCAKLTFVCCFCSFLLRVTPPWFHKS